MRADGSDRKAADGRRLLLEGGSPREILVRIAEGDPLGLTPIVTGRLTRRALLLDATRVRRRGLARCARYASRYRGRPALDAWLDEQVDAAIDDLLAEEAESSNGTRPAGDDAQDELAVRCGFDADAVRRACAEFNTRPDGDRRAFFQLLIEGRSLDDAAHAGGVSASEVARRARRALDGFRIRAREAEDVEDESDV